MNKTATIAAKQVESPYMYIAYMFLGVTACTSNGMLIWIIGRNKKFLTISNVIIISLATSDFMLGAIVSPMEMIHHLMPEFQIVGYGCLAHQVAMIFVPLVSIVHLLLVAVERFVKIVYPLHYHSIATRQRTAIMLTVAWMLTLSLCLIPFAGVNQNMEWTNGTDTVCSTLDMLPCPYLYCIISLVGMICVIMAVLYSKIMKIAFRHAREIRKTCFPKANNYRINKYSEIRALAVLIATVMYFVLSWAPFGISVVDECVSGIPTEYYTPVVFLAYFNSTINPVIYGIGNRDLRKSFLSVVCRKKNNEVMPFVTAATSMTVAESNLESRM